MIISKIYINNYRGFRNFEAKLSELSILIGENDSGKSNLLSALSLPLKSSKLEYTPKTLNISDINIESINEFYKSIKDDESKDDQIIKIPRVSIKLQFSEPQNNYEKEIVRKWLTENNGKECFEIEYLFSPKDEDEFLELTKELLKECKDEIDNERIWIVLPIDLFEYKIRSTNNSKELSYLELRNITVNNITAERDDFSMSNTMKSNNILTKLLMSILNSSEKNEINQAYIEFFSKIEDTESFKKILKYDKDFDNIQEYINEIDCIPNFPNLKNILSNITLGYGDEFLFQKGLGERNLVYLFLLFTHYKSLEKSFSLCCIEEPEAHLSVNNLKLAIDYIEKSVKNKNTLLQTVMSSHNPMVINKLNISNVIALSGNKSMSFKNIPSELINYLRKRPNFDILKLLFGNKVILVEGSTEEMFINTYLSTNANSLSNIDVISIGQKGYKTFLDIWIMLNKENQKKRIGIIRDFDNQPKAKSEHDKYDSEHENITVRTTIGYTLEDDLVATEKNCETLSKLFEIENEISMVVAYLKNGKTEGMLQICDAMIREEKPISLDLPNHINEVLEALS